MIFVTVGTSSWKFDRLVSEMDRIAGSIHEEVMIQFGASSVRLASAKGRDYLSPIEMDTLFKTARLVVAHAGSGTIIRVLRTNKPLIVIPRANTNEAYDTHQIELARALERDSRIHVVYDVAQLESVIRNIGEEVIDATTCHLHGDIVDKLRNYLDSIDNKRDKNLRVKESNANPNACELR